MQVRARVEEKVRAWAEVGVRMRGEGEAEVEGEGEGEGKGDGEGVAVERGGGDRRLCMSSFKRWCVDGTAVERARLRVEVVARSA